MAVLLGQTTEGSESSAAISAEFWMAFRFKVEVEGTIEELHATLSAAFTGTMKMALVEESAEKPFLGGAIEEGEKSLTAETAVAIAITHTKVKTGEFLWICLWPSVAGKFKSGSTTPRALATAKHAKVSEVTFGTNSNKGPGATWATGTESGAIKGQATGAILLGGTAKGATAEVRLGKATGPLALTGTAKGTAAQKVTGKATGLILLEGTGTPKKIAQGTISTLAESAIGAVGQKVAQGTKTERVGTAVIVVGEKVGAIVAKATGAMTLAGAAKGITAQRVAGKAAGPVLLTGSAVGTLKAVVTGNATGALLLTGASKGRAATVLKGKATGTLRLMGSATGATKAVVSGNATGALLITGTSTGTASAVLRGNATGTLYLIGSVESVPMPYSGLVEPRSLAGLVAPHSLGGEDVS